MRVLLQVNALQLNHDGTLLATCGNDRKVTTWNVPKGDKAKELSLDGWVRPRESPQPSVTEDALLGQAHCLVCPASEACIA